MTPRDQLLQRAVDYVSEHGLAELSLRPLAKELGTSARMLVYHFGSKEELVDAVMAASEHRWMETVKAILEAASDPLVALDSLWEELTRDESRRYLCTAYEAWGLSLSRPQQYRSYMQTMVEEWINFTRTILEQRGADPQKAGAQACFMMSAWNGLLLQWLGGGSRQQVSAAYQELRAWLETVPMVDNKESIVGKI